ncbi:cytochrome P450 [Modestobacter roseus]|uniref:cytochrome P450 n=1 Tax=Modestobacter roseus TaxID=1181884 RepID=UPI001297917D|nr:cytochrome P450 [Modestobacter roseus]MQA33649.1 cytochrome P450 [Modestobacter roseus]
MDERLARLRADAGLGLQIGVLRTGGLALAVGGDRVARLLHRPWRLDPYPVYRDLRAAQIAPGGGPVRSRTGITAVATHASCAAVLRDRRFGVRLADGRRRMDEGGAGGAAAAVFEPVDLSLLTLDPPDHTRLRRLAQPAFSPHRLVEYRAVAEDVAARLLDEALARDRREGRFDLVRDLASPLPITVISALLAVPAVDRERFARWGRVLGSALDGVRSPAHARQLADSTADLRELFGGLLELRRREPGDDVVSALATAVDDGGATVDEVLALAQLLLVAGFETTTNLIGNAVRALLAEPGQWRALTGDPSLAAAAVEETLRFDPPVQLTARVAHEDTEVDGVPIRRDHGVLVLLGAAGRDPAAHRDPDRFDVRRARTSAHLAFSSGAHYCLGAPLARLEAEVALRLLAERAPRLRVAGRAVPRVATVLRGPLRFPVSAGA